MVPDYYAMLGVDPSADRAAIELALARSQPIWSSGTRNPKTKHTSQSYLDQIGPLRQALLGEPAHRAAYDAERAASLLAERERRLDALQKLVSLRAAKGGLTVSDRRILRDEAAKLGLSPKDLDRLVEPIPPRPEPPAEEDAPEQPGDLLDPVTRRQLRVALEHLDRTDLYDALGLARDAPADVVTERADAERRRWMKKTQVTAEKTAWLEVATLAQSHLGTTTARDRYDRTLAREAEDRFEATTAFTFRGLRRLDPGTRSALLNEAAALGITADRAGRLIDRACRTHGVAIEVSVATATPAILPRTKLLRCRSCSGLTEVAAESQKSGPGVCRHCGSALSWSCPACRHVHRVDEPRCVCGFRMAWREPFLHHFESSRRAFRDRDYGTALAHLRRAQDFAPDHVGARNGVAKVRERLAEVERLRSDVDLARAGRRLFAARSALQAWGQLVDPASPAFRDAWEEVNQGLREASALAAKARSRERSDPTSARQLYRRAFAQAADLPDAAAGLERCPPDPPSDLTAVYHEDRLILRWSPPPADGLGPYRYVVRRKAESAFRHPREGAVVGSSDTAEWVDQDVVAGSSVAYAVLTVRNEVESLGAVTAGPIFLPS